MLVLNSNLEAWILMAIVLGIIVPFILFVVGLIILRKNKKRGKTILTIATIYSVISFGMCGGFGF